MMKKEHKDYYKYSLTAKILHLGFLGRKHIFVNVQN